MQITQFTVIHKYSTSKIFNNFPVIVKGSAQFLFLCNPQKSSVNVCLMTIIKNTVTNKVIVSIYNLAEKNF